MNKKGFTLLEIVLSLVILGCVIAIATPNITKLIDSNRTKSAETIEKMLISNLELYNKDRGSEIWCYKNNDSEGCITAGVKEVTYDELLTLNRDIELGDCLINKDDGLKIYKDAGENYSYSANIVCSKDFENRSTVVANESDLKNENIYYKSKE